MGAGIAQVSVDNGKYEVLLKDKNVEGVSRGEKVIVDELKAKLKKKRMTNNEFCTTTSRLVPLHDDVESWKRHFSTADLVIEAVFEVNLCVNGLAFSPFLTSPLLFYHIRRS